MQKKIYEWDNNVGYNIDAKILYYFLLTKAILYEQMKMLMWLHS